MFTNNIFANKYQPKWIIDINKLNTFNQNLKQLDSKIVILFKGECIDKLFYNLYVHDEQ